MTATKTRKISECLEGDYAEEILMQKLKFYTTVFPQLEWLKVTKS